MLTKVSFRTLKVLVAGCVMAVSAGCSLIPKEEEALKPPLVEPKKESYETVEVKRGSISRQVKGVGVFEPTNIKHHMFKQSGGKVMAVNVKAGDKVKKGDLLIQLDETGLDLDLKEKQLEVEKAKVGLEEAKEQQDTKNMRVKMMELEVAQVKLEKVRQTIAERKLLAEMDGIVTFVEDLKPGDVIGEYKVMVSIADTKGMRIAYEVTNPNDVSDVQVGMAADIKLKSKTLRGKVVQTPSSAPIVEDQRLSEKYAKTLYIEVLDPIPKDVEIGTLADIVITTQKRDNTLIIPKRGLRTYMGRNYVQILEGESRKEVDVEKGIEASTEVEIVQGLKEGQKVILQ